MLKDKKIKESHLDTGEKDRLFAILDKVKEKVIQQYYENIAEEGKNLGWSIGMFGDWLSNTFASKSDERKRQEIHFSCIELKDMSDDEAMFIRKVEEALTKG